MKYNLLCPLLVSSRSSRLFCRRRLKYRRAESVIFLFRRPFEPVDLAIGARRPASQYLLPGRSKYWADLYRCQVKPTPCRFHPTARALSLRAHIRTLIMVAF